MTAPLTVISVVYQDPAFWRRNKALVDRLNPGTTVQWLVVDNSPMPVLDGSDCADNVCILPATPYLPGRGAGSNHHAAALQSALAHVKSRYLLVLDHDFFVVLPGWIDAVLTHMAENRLAFLGAPWHPRWLYQPRGFPSPHFLLIDLERAPLATLDFTPGVSHDWLWRIYNHRLDGLPAAIRDRLKAGRLRDTGYRIAQRYRDARYEQFRVLYQRPQGLGPHLEQRFGRLIPDRFKVYPSAAELFASRSFLEPLAADVLALEWEEFTWRGAPLGFHLRRFGRDHVPVARHMDAEMLDQVLQGMPIAADDAPPR